VQDDQIACCRLARTLDASKQARAVVSEALGDALDRDRISDLALVVGELVNNAVRHGREPMGLRVIRRGHGVRVELHDGSTELPRFTEPRPQGGFGMHLISALADRWGTDRYDDRGKRVWVEFCIHERS
jgi:anti-sigma regulatory factor (Ser/Thr protein kinase)